MSAGESVLGENMPGRFVGSVRGVCWDWGERHCSKSATGGLGIVVRKPGDSGEREFKKAMGRKDKKTSCVRCSAYLAFITSVS